MAGDIYFAKPGPTLGANLGSSLGSGLALGIMDLVDRKVERMSQRDSEKAFEEAGYSKAQSQAFSKLPKEERKEIWKRSFNREQTPAEGSLGFWQTILPPEEAAFVHTQPLGIQQTLLKSIIERGGFLGGVQAPQAGGLRGVSTLGAQPQYEAPTNIRDMGAFGGIPQGGGLEALQGMQPQGGFDLLQQLTPQLNLLPQQMQGGIEALQQLRGAQNVPQFQETTPQEQMTSQGRTQNPTQRAGLAEILSRPFETKPEKTARLGRELSAQQFEERQALNEKKVNQADKHFNLQQTKDYRERLEDLYKTDQDELRQRKVARQLHERGKLQSPLMASILRTAGLDWDALRSADSQVLASMIEPALKKLKPTFGANTSNLELLNVLKTHWSDPTKSSTSREFLLDLADVRSEQIKAEHEAYRNIMKQTGNNPPPDIRLLVSEQAQQKTDDAFDAFENKWLSKFGGATAQAGALDVKLVNTFTKAPSAKDNEGKYMKHKGQWFEARNGKWTKVS